MFVCGGGGNIVQFVYGDDGMDSCHIESQPLYLTKLSYKDGSLQDKFRCDCHFPWKDFLSTPALKSITTVSRKVK